MRARVQIYTCTRRLPQSLRFQTIIQGNVRVHRRLERPGTENRETRIFVPSIFTERCRRERWTAVGSAMHEPRVQMLLRARLSPTRLITAGLRRPFESCKGHRIRRTRDDVSGLSRYRCRSSAKTCFCLLSETPSAAVYYVETRAREPQKNWNRLIIRHWWTIGND